MTANQVGQILMPFGIIAMIVGLFQMVGLYWSLTISGALMFICGSFLVKDNRT